MTDGKSMVELIKVEWPHGTEIQVSFSPLLDSWVLSDSKTTGHFPF